MAKKQNNMVINLNQGRELLIQRQNVGAQNAGAQNVVVGAQNAGIEGFGILGNFPGTLTPIDTKNERDETDLRRNSALFETKKTSYKNAYIALKNKTSEFLNDIAEVTDNQRNYNLFINESITPSNINSTRQGCYNYSDPSSKQPPGAVYLNPETVFNTYYADKDITADNAKDACELWAVEGKKTLYGINTNSTGKFQCYTGNISDLSNVTSSGIYTKTITLMTLVSSTNNTAFKGGLFRNGQIGLADNSGTLLTAMPSGPDIMPNCNIKSGGGINQIFASYGRNCNNIETELPNVRFILVSHATKYLQISQIAAYGLDTNKTIQNFAKNKPVFAELEFDINCSKNAVVDGVVSSARAYKGGQKSVYISQTDTNGWLEIDLGTFGNENKLFLIKFFGRADSIATIPGTKIQLLNSSRIKISEINITESGAIQAFPLVVITNPSTTVPRPLVNPRIIRLGPNIIEIKVTDPYHSMGLSTNNRSSGHAVQCRFKALEAGNYLFMTIGRDWDTYLEIMKSATNKVIDDDSGPGRHAAKSTALIANEVVDVWVGGFKGGYGTTILTVRKL